MGSSCKLYFNRYLLKNSYKNYQAYYATGHFVERRNTNLHLKEKEKEMNDALKVEINKNTTSLHWEELRKKLINREIRGFEIYVTSNNVDSVIMRLCNDFKLFDAGQSFFRHLKETNSQLNVGILSHYLNLCTLNRQFAVENKQQLIDICKKLTNGTITEPLIAERCIATVSLFEDHWKESLILLEKVKYLSEPTPSSYNAIAEACFKFGDIEKGWQLLRHVVAKTGAKPKPECYNAYINYSAGAVSDKTTVIEELFKFLEEYQLHIPNLDVLDKLEKFIFSLSDDEFIWSLKETYIPKSGVCSNCRRVLEPAQISSEEFQELCKNFAAQALIGSNVFLKSNPEEIQRYKRFIEKAHSCDIVIDGLNAAYATGSKNPHAMSKILRSVVDHFLRKKMKVVILGRMHMRTWPDMSYFNQNCNVFLATNLSHDDPLLLYAALRGGEKTCFISRDLMRSHTFLLEDPRMKRLFRKWLVSHQYILGFFDRNGRPSILPPLPYQPTAQKLPLTTGELCWHLPYDEEYVILPPEKREPPPKWLCIRRIPR